MTLLTACLLSKKTEEKKYPDTDSASYRDSNSLSHPHQNHQQQLLTIKQLINNRSTIDKQ